jgi:hypothetical protein
LKRSPQLATWPILIFIFLAVPAFGQVITNPGMVNHEASATLTGTFDSITISSGGNLIGTGLTVQNANVQSAQRVLLTGPAATANLSNTTIGLQNDHVGISAVGPDAVLTLSGLSVGSPGGSDFGVTASAGALVQSKVGSLSFNFTNGDYDTGLNVTGNGTMLSLTNTAALCRQPTLVL